MVRRPPKTLVHARPEVAAWTRRGSQFCLALVLATGVSGCAGKNQNGSSAHANTGQTVADLDWKQRVAINDAEYKRTDPDQHQTLSSRQPSEGPGGNPTLDGALIQGNKRAAPVLVTRLMSGESEDNRRALAEALPTTGGDWQEPAAALIKLDADAKVRIALVQSMRYAEAPHSVEGLKAGFADEDPKVQAAAARTTGFSKEGRMLYDELHSSLFAEDWDLRAAAAQSLGKLEMQEARTGLIRALGDEHPEVRLYALVALEKIVPAGVANIPEVHQLTKDSDERVAKEARRIVIAPPK